MQMQCRVPDAVRHSSCRSAEPGPYRTPVLGAAPALQRTASRRATRCAASGAQKRSRRVLRDRLAPAQEAAEQAAPALARNELDVADQLGAALAPLKHDLAAMEGFQL